MWDILVHFKNSARAWRLTRWEAVYELLSDPKSDIVEGTNGRREWSLGGGTTIVHESFADFTSEASVYHATCLWGGTNQRGVLDKKTFKNMCHVALFSKVDSAILSDLANAPLCD